jgi:hypothetical protein
LETEQLVLSRSLNIPIVEIPIHTIYENSNASSHFDPFLDSLRIYFVILRYTLSSILTWAVDVIAFLFFIDFSDSVVFSNLGSRAFAIGIQFYLLKTFVFRARAGFTPFLLFILYVTIMGLVSAALQTELSATMRTVPLLSKILADCFIFVFNFLFLRDFLFTRGHQQ